ncbi:fibronectin type III domain-containing protein [Acetobacteroides hydrogenigenes]|uniref:Putative secreted protein (Por secretion system target) n=1 Tax=Acetobacteroides hydrogenigenes TaxID=979970 RepID=A0A4R2F0M3_9BACT|nr:Ig-like domain repeat protein [Acetobacteroides hydrogenigenes]TCN72855.1 putative secreted protein (Por secretion system target) [Acetobacteroides hydrogenigenes]
MKRFLLILALWLSSSVGALGQTAAPARAAVPKRRSIRLPLAALLLAALLALGGQASAQTITFQGGTANPPIFNGGDTQYTENGITLGIKMSNADNNPSNGFNKDTNGWGIYSTNTGTPTTVTITCPGYTFNLDRLALEKLEEGDIRYTVTTSKGVSQEVDFREGLWISDISNPDLFKGIDSFTITLKTSALNLLLQINTLELSGLTLIASPSAPTAVTATPGDGIATVSFTPPTNDGGAPVTGYTVTSSPGSIKATGTQSPIVVTGLTNGIEYTFTVTASNIAKVSAPSAASAPVTPVYKPDVLIVSNNNYDETQATAQLQKDFADRYDVTVSTTGVPSYPYSYSQIYDVRVREAITDNDLNQYYYFLRQAPGKSVFVVGERNDNTSFTARNQSISKLIEKLGGGTVAPPSKISIEPVALKTPFNTGASSVSTVTLTSPGLVTSSGKGSFIATEADGTSGAGIYFPHNTLAYAPQGCLVVMYDVNFLYNDLLVDSYGNEMNYDPLSNQKELRANLEQVMAAGGTLPGPSTSSVSLSANPNPVGVSAPVTITATVTGGVSGKVQFIEDAKIFGRYTLENGVATLTTNSLELGTHTITAQYSGDAEHNASTSEAFKFVVCTAPDAPTIGAATADDGQATVSFTPPASDGGSPITGYTVTATPGNITATGTTSPIVVTGLTNGTDYTFTVTASNAALTSAPSAATNSVKPQKSQTISFTNPGAQLYGTTPTLTATATSGLQVTFTTTTPNVCTISSGGTLSFTSAGTCTVVADQAGNAPYKAAPSVPQSFAVNPVAPAAPIGVTAIAGDEQARVEFFQPANDGGAPVTSYTVTATPGGITETGTMSPIVVTGLTNGIEYTFTVTGSNIAKESAPSEASAPVTPFYKPDVLVVSNNQWDEKGAAHQLQMDLSNRFDVTVSTSGVPASLDGYAQIYDVRVTEPITSSDATLYADFLRNNPKKSLFLAGECLWFKYRNQSISSFIQQLGGGTIAPPVAESDPKKVALKVPFNAGASSISTVHLDGYGIVTESGNGSFITTEADGTSGAGLYFPQGTLANAPTGSLVVMYDITFLASAASYNYAFRMNLEQVMAAGGTLAGPSASTISLSGTPNPTAKHSPVTFTATVTPGATGEVQFSEDGIVLENVTIDNGVATYSYPSIGLGERSIKAKYIGDASYNSSTSEVFKLNVYDVPDAPTIGTATAGDGQATVNFTPSAYDGGLPITGYTVTATPGNITATGTASPITVTGLANGTEYSFTVTTSNAVGTGAASAVSNSIKPMHTSVIAWSNPADITYGTALGDAQLNATADVPGTFAYTPAAGSVLNAGNAQAITATFTPTDKGNTTESKTLTISVAKAPLTVTASSHTITKGEAIPVLTVSYSGFVNSEDQSVLDIKPTATTSATATSPVGEYAIIAADGIDGNYSFTYVDGKLTILDKRIPTITWAEPNGITYGTPLSDEQLNATASYSGAAVAGSFTYTPTAGTTLAAGKHELKVTFTPTDGDHYISVEKTVAITVGKVPLTATATSYSIREGEAIPVLGVTYKGFVNGDTEAVLDTKPTATTTATATSPTGVYDITVAGGADDSYEFAYVAGKLTISNPIVVNALKAPQPACEGDKLSLAYTLTSGRPTEYQIVFDAKALTAGFSNSGYAALPTDDGTVSFSIPARVTDGTYQATLQLRDGYGNISEPAAFQVTVNVSADVIVPKFGSVVLIDNHNGRFTGYQWYKNGSAIGGATSQFYKDPNGLSGTYYAQLKTATGQTVNTCSKALSIKKSAQASVSVYPNPARAGQELTVKLSGFADEELQGAVLTVYSTQGVPVLTSRKVEQENRITLSGTDGVYMGRIATADGQVLTFKVVLAN